MSGVEDCFYHEALADGVSKTRKQAPAISQIPGWGAALDDGNSSGGMTGCGRRIGLFEHDSEYTKLAKMGGRVNLLHHLEPIITKKEAVAYPKPDWMVYESFTPAPTTKRINVIPDYMNYDRPQLAVPIVKGKPPWAEDGQSVFAREGNDNVKNYRTSPLKESVKPGQKRLGPRNVNNNNNNNDNNNNNNNNINNNNNNNSSDDVVSASPLWSPQRRSAKIRLGELESEFRSSRRFAMESLSDSTTSGRTAAAAAASRRDVAVTSGDAAATSGYSPSTGGARRNPEKTTEDYGDYGD